MAEHFSYTPILSNKDFEIKDFNDKFTEVETYLNSSRDDIDSNKSRLDTLSTIVSENTTNISGLDTRISNAETRITNVENGKVDKVSGKGLSTNDFTDNLYSKVFNSPRIISFEVQFSANSYNSNYKYAYISSRKDNKIYFKDDFLEDLTDDGENYILDIIVTSNSSQNSSIDYVLVDPRAGGNSEPVAILQKPSVVANNHYLFLSQGLLTLSNSVTPTPFRVFSQITYQELNDMKQYNAQSINNQDGIFIYKNSRPEKVNAEFFINSCMNLCIEKYTLNGNYFSYPHRYKIYIPSNCWLLGSSASSEVYTYSLSKTKSFSSAPEWVGSGYDLTCNFTNGGTWSSDTLNVQYIFFKEPKGTDNKYAPTY